jgi:xanthine dehydrogenase accessory factor
MQEIIPDIDNWLAAGKKEIAIATVLQTWGSAPRQTGAKMAFTTSSDICGSVSGGCIESAVIEAGQDVLATGSPQLLHFGVTDETAWDVGLACGGTIEVFVERLDLAAYAFLRDLIRAGKPGVCLTVLHGDEALTGRKLVMGDGRSLNQRPLDLTDLGRSARATQRRTLENGLDLFIERLNPAPTLIMVGGVHIAVALASLAKTLGYRTIVIDPRRAFGSAARFPHADQLLPLWPQKAFAKLEITPETAVALLTHDPKIDDPALKSILPSPAFYIGALGSRKTHAKRRQRLRANGFTDKQIARIHAPIGLNIHAATPAEIALAIIAEIIQTYRTPGS